MSKYVIASLPLLFGNEIISLIALNILAWMFITDIAKEAAK